MAITLVGTGQIGTAVDGGDVTLTFDGSPAENDMVLVYGAPALITAPSIVTAGYTTILTFTGGAGHKAGIVARKFLGASPDATVVGEGGGDSRDAVLYGSYVFRGVDLTTPIDVTSVTAYGDGAGLTHDAPSITTVTDDAWVIALILSLTASITGNPVSGYGNALTGSRADTFTIAGASCTKQVVTAGAENPPAWTSNGATWSAATIALRPAAGGGGGDSGPPLGGLPLLGVGR